jgi:hypothetical protein
MRGEKASDCLWLEQYCTDFWITHLCNCEQRKTRKQQVIPEVIPEVKRAVPEVIPEVKGRYQRWCPE